MAERTRRLVATLVLALGVVVIVWPWLVQPRLEWEDGALLFARSFDEFELSDWWQPYGGYVPFGSNLLASLACLLPTAWIPTAFVAAAAAVSVAAGAWILRPQWQPVAPFAARCLIAVVVAWLPLATRMERTSLAYAQWPALWWLMMVLFEPGSQRSPLRAVLAASLAMWHPLTPLLVPLGILKLWRDARQPHWWGLLVGVAVACAVRAVVGGGSGAPQSLVLPDGGDLWWLLSVRAVFETLVGERLRTLVEQAGVGWLATASVVAPVLLGFVFVRGWRRLSCAARTFVVETLAVGIGTVLVAVVLRGVCRYDDPTCVRYLSVARQALLATLVVVLARQLSTRALVGFGVLLSVCLIDGNRSALVQRLGNDRLRAFVHELERQEERRGGRTWIRARLDREGQPPIVIRPH